MEPIAPTEGPYVVVGGKKYLDFSSCDFLGLAQHPEVKKGAIKYALKYGVGTPPNSICSTPQLEVESKLAHYLGRESALLLSSISELYSQMKELGAALFSTESEDITSVKKSKGPKIADNTFLLGMTGSNGFGSSNDPVDAVCGSFLFGSGAFIAGPKKLLSQIKSAPLSFPTLGALDCALTFILEMDAERKMVQKHRIWLLKQLGDWEITKLNSSRILIQSAHAPAIRHLLLQEQIYLAPLRDNTLYFSMTALHTPDDLDQLGTALKKLATTDLALAMQSLTPTP